MSTTEVILPRSVVYFIDEYKLQLGIAYSLMVAALLLPLFNKAESLASNRAEQAIVYDIPTYPLSHQPQVAVANMLPTANTNNLPDGSAIWPLRGRVTTEFGVPHAPWQKTHTGIDITSAQRSGSAAVAVFRQGTVSQVSRSGGYGNHVVVDHGGGLSSLYGHLSDISVIVGQQLRAGDIIGHEGRSGTATGTHLHFEVLVGGKPVNPHRYVAGSPN